MQVKVGECVRVRLLLSKADVFNLVTVKHVSRMEEEEDRAECPVSSGVSLKSGQSEGGPVDVRDEAGPSKPE